MRNLSQPQGTQSMETITRTQREKNLCELCCVLIMCYSHTDGDTEAHLFSPLNKISFIIYFVLAFFYFLFLLLCLHLTVTHLFHRFLRTHFLPPSCSFSFSFFFYFSLFILFLLYFLFYCYKVF